MPTWLPLTAAQRGLFFAHQLAPDNPCYTTAEVVEVTGPVDPARLRAALATAYDEFEQLRTTYRLAPEGPQQRVVARRPDDRVLVVLDVASTAEAEAWMRADLARPMDLLAGEVTRSALLRLHDGGSWWYHAAHHVVLDGYGAQQLLRRVAELYDAPAAPRRLVPLADLVASQDCAATDEGAAERAWEARLATMHGTASPSGRSADPAPAATRRHLTLTAEQQLALTTGARRLGVAWPDLVVTAVGAYVARVASLPQARIGLPLMNRVQPGVGTLPSARTVCSAMNVLPATVPARGDVGEALRAVSTEQQANRAHPYVRQEELARRLRSRSAGAQLFGVQVNLVPFDLELAFGSAPALVRNLAAGPVEDLTVCLRGAPGRRRTVRLEVDANPHLYDVDEVERHLERLVRWLETFAAAEPGAAVADLALPTPQERDLVLRDFNDTHVERVSATLGERFRAQVALTPDATALVMGGARCTYSDLLERAERVAALLAGDGVGAGDVVGVALPRSFDLYAAVHAIALLDAVYLPLDPDLPAARVEAMVDDAGAQDVIDAAWLARPHGQDVVRRPGAPDVDAPAYLLFTSGSTGRPKGVPVSHRAIDNRLAWMQHHLPLAVGERVLHKTPISFDVSVWELYWPLQVGATVVIAEPGAHRDPRRIADLVVRHDVTTLHFVPSMLRAFLADPRSREHVSAGRVRHVVTSGEALTPDLVAGCATWFGVPPTNLYGPTEAAVDVTVWDCARDDAVVPIGRPVWNTVCYVLDEHLAPVPPGVRGELWLGGVQLAQGYVGRPDLTAERFRPDPFREGRRIYRTGDLASWRPDGALLYLGRTDDQVKVRGQRVELGEVEAAAVGADGVTAVAAGVVADRLVAWFVAGDGVDAAKAEASLREAARAALPSGLVPQLWVAVPEIPLGTSGKTDRARLAAIAPPVVETDGGDGPRGLLEQRVCGIVAEVLQVAVVGPDDDFFELGGDSLRVLRLLGILEQDLGAVLSLADVFAAPTPSGLASLVADDSRADAPDAEPGTDTDTGELLTLRGGSPDVPPLILLPPAGGLGWCYAGLLRSLPRTQGVHVVQAPGLTEGRPEVVADLGALAARQLATIRDLVGRARFHVAGWSLGGMAAHAVAARARDEGQPVGAVVLLDAYPSDQWRHLAEPTEAEALVGVLRLGGIEAPAGVRLDRDTAVELLRTSGSAVGRLPERVLAGCVAAVVEAARLVRTSQHRVLPGDLTVLVAGAPRAETWLDPAGWTPYVGGEVRTVRVDATHGDLVRRPAVDEVGSVLAELLVTDAPVAGTLVARPS
ncbi:amino acid adenylation domain-containing protein [Nocardioides sp.]|uniref:amino acid adenylation domain-containing protein n=1 Tax=Nocardioides sp. TaxID=35761 RepID=UPI0026310852|nr:amino acid adenylation domain-containing protein [Nocardioides sp.]